VHKCCKFYKNRARDLPHRSNCIGKIPNFQDFGAVNPHPEAIKLKVKLGREQTRSSLPNFTLISATCRGEKPKNRHLSKNNTGRSTLRAVLPVTKWKHRTVFSYTDLRRSLNFHQTLLDDRGSPCHHCGPNFFWIPSV